MIIQMIFIKFYHENTFGLQKQTQMQPHNWLKTKKKYMEPTQTDSHTNTIPLFPFDQLSTSKKSKPIQGHLILPSLITSQHQPEISPILPDQTPSKSRLPISQTADASIDLSLNKMQSTSHTQPVSEYSYDPNQMLSFLSQFYQKPYKFQHKLKQPQINQQNESQDLSQSDDRISIFTFAPILNKDHQTVSFIDQQQQVQDQPECLNDQSTQIVEKIQRQAKQIKTQNPLLQLKPEDFDLLNSSDVNYELYFAKRNDQFLKNYVDHRYQPQKQELRKQIKQEMIELMKVKQGKYLTNIIFTEVLEEILNLDQLEGDLDEQIEKCQAKVKKSLSKSSLHSGQQNSNGSIEICRIQTNFNSESKKVRNYFDSTSQKQRYCHSQEKIHSVDLAQQPKDLFDFPEIFFQERISQTKSNYQCPEFQQTKNNQEHILDQLNEQIQTLKEKISKQEDSLNEQIQTQTALKIFCEKQQIELDQIQNYKQFINRQLQSLKQKLDLSNQKFQQDKQKIQHQSNILQAQIQEIIELNEQKQKELLQHLFDVFYIEVQNFSNKLLKHSMDKKKWKPHSEMDKNQLENTILNQFYQAIIKSNLLQNHLQKSKFIQQINQFSHQFNSWKLKQDNLLDFYSKLQTFLKIYFFMKIQAHRATENIQSKENSSFVQNLFNLFDTNSYHSQAVKSTFFKFQQLFVQYGHRIFYLLFEEFNQDKKNQEKIRNQDSFMIEKDWMGFGRSSNVSTKRRLTKRKQTKSNQRNYIDALTTIFKDLGFTNGQISSQKIQQFIRNLILVADD